MYKEKYEDILHLERPNSVESQIRHPRMSLYDRAKIFSPFAALRGHGSALHAEDLKQLLEPKRIPSEELQEQLSKRLTHLKKGDKIEVTYFSPNILEPHLGNYVHLNGVITKIDESHRILYLNSTPIPFYDLWAIQYL